MIDWGKDKPFWKHGLPKCHHTEARAVAIPGPRRAIREQCPQCGKIANVLKAGDHPDAPPADMALAERWESERAEAGAAAQALAQKRHAMRQAAKVDESASWFEQYGTYLQSDDWQRRRAKVFARDGHRCQAWLPGCTGTATDCHHKSYLLQNEVGAAPLHELVSLCHNCHEVITLAERKARAEKTTRPRK